MRFVVAVLALSLLASAQSLEVPTHFVWALDQGGGSSPSIRIYTPTGNQIANLNTLPGSGGCRALSFDADGRAYLCRGNVVHQLNRLGAATGVQFVAPAGANNAQDAQVLPDGRLVVGWGTDPATSALGFYNRTTGALLQTFTSSTLDQPRRLAVRSNGTDLYIANRQANSILRVDLTSMTLATQLVVNLTAQNVGPVGLTYDRANDDLWVASDWGQADVIGCIDLATNTYSTAINYPPTGAAGLRAPGGLSYDRFRRLYVAGRNTNMGVAGVYIFDAPDPSVAPTLVDIWPNSGGAPTSIIDVEAQPSEQDTCVATELVGTVSQPTFVLGANNRVTFSNPGTPSAMYAAAISLRWTASACGEPFAPGRIQIPFPVGDPRGIPLSSDGLFWSSVAVAVPGPSPIPPAIDPVTMAPFPNNISPLVQITGFFGTLDASGDAEAFVDLTNLLDPGNALGTDGIELSLAWVTLDGTTPSGIGYIAQPVCVVLRNPDASPVVLNAICP